MAKQSQTKTTTSFSLQAAVAVSVLGITAFLAFAGYSVTSSVTPTSTPKPSLSPVPTVTIVPVKVNSFTGVVSDPSVPMARFDWVTSGSTSVRIDPYVGAVSPSGAVFVNVDPGTTVFTLTAVSAAGRAIATVTLAAVTQPLSDKVVPEGYIPMLLEGSEDNVYPNSAGVIDSDGINFLTYGCQRLYSADACSKLSEISGEVCHMIGEDGSGIEEESTSLGCPDSVNIDIGDCDKICSQQADNIQKLSPGMKAYVQSVACATKKKWCNDYDKNGSEISADSAKCSCVIKVMSQ